MKRVEILLNITKLLRTVSYFSNLDNAALDLVARSAIRRVYDEEQVVLLEGEPCAGLCIVESGWLKAIKIGLDGREQVLQMLKPGDAFNIISIFTDAPNQATVTALEASQVWIIPRNYLLTLMAEQPAFALQVVKDLAGRVIHLIHMVEDLSLRSVEARLARLILEQAEGNLVRRQRWATQAAMATRLGTVPDVVNRALRKLAGDGIVMVERHQIQILNRDKLRSIAQLIE
jgi:CRP/FNR family cyclic AMP-dependent transcriptional regulator